VPINSNSVIYHWLLGVPFSTYGENVVVLLQNLFCVTLIWNLREKRVPKREMVGMSAAFILLCTCLLQLPKQYLPILIYANIPFIFFSTFPQVMANFNQGHTGQLALTSIFLKMVGCIVRLFTTVTQIGMDVGLLTGYTTGLVMNGIIVCQGIAYRKETARVNAEEKAKGLLDSPASGQASVQAATAP